MLDVSIENTSEPEEFQNARMKLEAFADSKFNLHALHMPVERLRELSAEAYRVAQAKWNERGDSNFANIAEALRKCDEAINYLKTEIKVREGTAYINQVDSFLPSITFLADTRLTQAKVFLSITGPLDNMTFTLLFRWNLHITAIKIR